MGKFLKWTKVPVYKVKMGRGRNKYHQENLLFDLKEDYAQKNPINDKEIEVRMCQLMVKEMKNADVPEEQFERMGL
jgi:hypothetical protein